MESGVGPTLACLPPVWGPLSGPPLASRVERVRVGSRVPRPVVSGGPADERSVGRGAWVPSRSPAGAPPPCQQPPAGGPGSAEEAGGGTGPRRQSRPRGPLVCPSVSSSAGSSGPLADPARPARSPQTRRLGGAPAALEALPRSGNTAVAEERLRRRPRLILGGASSATEITPPRSAPSARPRPAPRPPSMFAAAAAAGTGTARSPAAPAPGPRARSHGRPRRPRETGRSGRGGRLCSTTSSGS